MKLNKDVTPEKNAIEINLVITSLAERYITLQNRFNLAQEATNILLAATCDDDIDDDTLEQMTVDTIRACNDGRDID